MRECICRVLLLLTALSCVAAERQFDFGKDKTLPGFRSTVMGEGKPGEWKVLLDEVPPMLAPLNPQAPATTKQPVLAQLATDPTDEHFPLLVYEGETFGDFKLTTRIRMVSGVKEQMAGIAFRVQNETNYYVVRASSLGGTFRFYKVLDGQRGPLVGPELPIPSGVWHELTVECKGSDIKCSLNGKELISVSDKANALTSGKIGFWTKSDSVSYFADAKLVYTPFKAPAQALVTEVAQKYPRLLGLKLYILDKQLRTPRMVASNNEQEVGGPGGKSETEVIGRGETYYGKEKDHVSVIMPLRDRNGETIAAVRVVLKSFPGQTEETAIIRAAPVVKALQSRVASLEDLAE